MESTHIIILLTLIIVLTPVIIGKFFIVFQKDGELDVYLTIQKLYFEKRTFEEIRYALIKKYGMELDEAMDYIIAAQEGNYEFFKEHNL